MRDHKLDKLSALTLKHETNTNVLARLKYMCDNDRYGYVAGTLIVLTRDLVNQERCVYLDINTIADCVDKLEKKIMYYVSVLYKKHKGKSCAFYNIAVQNIKDYELELEAQ